MTEIKKEPDEVAQDTKQQILDIQYQLADIIFDVWLKKLKGLVVTKQQTVPLQ